jgi:hypothetical protein
VDPMSVLIGVAIALVVLLVLDLVVAGGAMTGGAAGGVCAAVGTPWGWLGLLILIGLAGALLWPRPIG